MLFRISSIVLAIIFFFGCQDVSAQVSITEIMYDLSGTDTGREWVEITNSGSGNVTIATSTWKFFEADTNHSISLFQGSVVIPAGGFAVIVDNPAKFLADWPNFSGTIFDSVFSLANSGEAIAVKSDASTIVDQVTYASTMGAAGDGNSLQKSSGAWTALAPTVGAANQNGQGGSSGGQTTNPPVATTAPDNTSGEEDSTPTSEGVKTSWPVEPQIISRIMGPSVAIAGADIVFRGEAVGLDKKPIKNTRFLWNFGDGATKEGESVMHAYNFPAEYVVILEASSGHFEGSSRVRVKIIPADIIVGEVVSGFDGKIELVNKAKQELDLSWWRVRSGDRFFTLPKNTKILPAGRLPLSAAVMGFPVVNDDVALLYPNGSLAHQFIKSVSEQAEVVPVASTNTPASELPAAAVVPEISAELPVEVTPKVSGQAAGVALAVSAHAETEIQNAVVSDNNVRPSSSLWLYGTGGVILLGLAFALFPKPTVKKSPADEFTVVED
ncbi:MAG: S-layer-like protein array protein [Parcubacteria group bacterium GW2011_GWA2_47_16]|nr:MAG: S-layer-like protein array protein [Parcubacteria group bacterium GW2011_GWA2_47_16]